MMKNLLNKIGIFLGIIEDKSPKFNPNAVDGDGDGMVQDGTIHERPAPAKKSGAKTSGMTPAQKELPPFIQAAIAKKKKKK
jgi:hypothetical protein